MKDLERLKGTHHIKHNAIHLKTLECFTEEDMDFDEVAKSAVTK